jgi:folate-binding protein YgfZ
VLRTAADFWLITDPQILDRLVKRLRMFILRTQVEVTLNPAWQVGFSHASENSQNAALDLSEKPVESRFPTVLPFEFTLNTEGIPGAMDQNTFSAAASDSNNTFRLACIRNGLPLIFAQTHEMFIPQSVNLDLIGGVSFQKGCYPGQEIVARVRYLGRVKTRMILGTVETTTVIAPGTVVTGGSEESTQQGVVVDAAKNRGTGAWEVLASIPIAWLQDYSTAKTRIGGKSLVIQPLPYGLGMPE